MDLHVPRRCHQEPDPGEESKREHVHGWLGHCPAGGCTGSISGPPAVRPAHDPGHGHPVRHLRIYQTGDARHSLTLTEGTPFGSIHPSAWDVWPLAVIS